MLSVRWLFDQPAEVADGAAEALVRAAASSSADENPERAVIVERAMAAGVWHVGPAALPIPLLSL